MAGAHAQLIDNPDWKESEVPSPPSFSTQHLLEIQMPSYISLRYGVDPQTIKVTPDGIVRFVVVAQRQGSNSPPNVFYDGVRCATDETRTYARHYDGAWQMTPNDDWKPYRDLKSGYSAALASQVLCNGHAPRQSVTEMIRFLKQPNQPS